MQLSKYYWSKFVLQLKLMLITILSLLITPIVCVLILDTIFYGKININKNTSSPIIILISYAVGMYLGYRILKRTKIISKLSKTLQMF